MEFRFQGRWVGETIGYESPAHIWEITQTKTGTVFIESRWEHESQATRMYGTLGEQGDSFGLGDRFTAILIDSHHFVIREWDTNDRRGQQGPDYDVIFSRPGLAELHALTVYQQWVQQRHTHSG